MVLVPKPFNVTFLPIVAYFFEPMYVVTFLPLALTTWVLRIVLIVTTEVLLDFFVVFLVVFEDDFFDEDFLVDFFVVFLVDFEDDFFEEDFLVVFLVLFFELFLVVVVVTLPFLIVNLTVLLPEVYCTEPFTSLAFNQYLKSV